MILQKSLIGYDLDDEDEEVDEDDQLMKINEKITGVDSNDSQENEIQNKKKQEWLKKIHRKR